MLAPFSMYTCVCVCVCVCASPSKQPLMVRTFLTVYMELGSYYVSVRTNRRHTQALREGAERFLEVRRIGEAKAQLEDAQAACIRRFEVSGGRT
jgi:hypothetical protein